ncbi:hypothetical protein ACGFY9_01540 [Streptomyces sp. NPDC048504]|uniref:hypothetical protein n=1 Tax=Streptomyces sp. NPDC048504 TaxID=3365559 RepID=UPI0037106C38
MFGDSRSLLRDELFPPFGDARACAGSDLKLPGAITAGGATIPADATDVHYRTRNGAAQVTSVEVSTLYGDAFRVPARAVVGCATP